MKNTFFLNSLYFYNYRNGKILLNLLLINKVKNQLRLLLYHNTKQIHMIVNLSVVKTHRVTLNNTQYMSN